MDGLQDGVVNRASLFRDAVKALATMDRNHALISYIHRLSFRTLA